MYFEYSQTELPGYRYDETITRFNFFKPTRDLVCSFTQCRSRYDGVCTEISFKGKRIEVTLEEEAAIFKAYKEYKNTLHKKAQNESRKELTKILENI